MNLFSPVVGVDDMNELELEPCWSCNKIVVNEENAHSAVDEGDYIAFVCAKCGEEE